MVCCRSSRGVTLLEVLIVVIILGILASLAIPQYIKTVEKAKAGEAINSLRLIFTGERIYKLENKVYYPSPDATGSDEPDIESYLKIYLEDKHYDYSITSSGGGSSYIATATRRPGAPDDYAGRTIIINQAGDWDGTSPFKP